MALDAVFSGRKSRKDRNIQRRQSSGSKSAIVSADISAWLFQPKQQVKRERQDGQEGAEHKAVSVPTVPFMDADTLARSWGWQPILTDSITQQKRDQDNGDKHAKDSKTMLVDENEPDETSKWIQIGRELFQRHWIEAQRWRFGEQSRLWFAEALDLVLATLNQSHVEKKHQSEASGMDVAKSKRTRLSRAEVETVFQTAMQWLADFQALYYACVTYKGCELRRSLPALVFDVGSLCHLILSPSIVNSVTSTSSSEDKIQQLTRQWGKLVDDCLIHGMARLGKLLEELRSTDEVQSLGVPTSGRLSEAIRVPLASSSSSSSSASSASALHVADARGLDAGDRKTTGILEWIQTPWNHDAHCQSWHAKLEQIVNLSSAFCLVVQQTRTLLCLGQDDVQRQQFASSSSSSAKASASAAATATKSATEARNAVANVNQSSQLRKQTTAMCEEASRLWSSIKSQLSVLERAPPIFTERKARQEDKYIGPIALKYRQNRSLIQLWEHRFIPYEPTSENRYQFRELACAYILSCGGYMRGMRTQQERPAHALEFPRMNIVDQVFSEDDVQRILRMIHDGDYRNLAKPVAADAKTRAPDKEAHPLLPMAHAFASMTSFRDVTKCHVLQDHTIHQDLFHRRKDRLFQHTERSGNIVRLCRPVLVALLGNWYVADREHGPGCSLFRRDPENSDTEEDKTCPPRLFACDNMCHAFSLWVAIVLAHYDGELEMGQPVADWLTSIENILKRTPVLAQAILKHQQEQSEQRVPMDTST